jgi:hypothetical protein
VRTKPKRDPSFEIATAHSQCTIQGNTNTIAWTASRRCSRRRKNSVGPRLVGLVHRKELHSPSRQHPPRIATLIVASSISFPFRWKKKAHKNLSTGISNVPRYPCSLPHKFQRRNTNYNNQFGSPPSHHPHRRPYFYHRATNRLLIGLRLFRTPCPCAPTLLAT